MAYIQRNVPPPNQVIPFAIRNMAGGLNNRSTQLADHEAWDILNMTFADETTMERRFGVRKFVDTDFARPITFIDAWKPYNDGDVLVTGSEFDVKIGNRTINTDTPVRGVNFNGCYFLFSGSDIFAHMKVPPRSLAGDYVKFIGDTDAWRNANPEFSFKVVNPGANTPLPEPHVKGVTVYNFTNGTVYYEPCKKELEDPYKGANVVPSNSRFATVFNGRIYASGDYADDDNVFLTDAGNGFYFPVALPLQLTPNSDRVNGLYVYDNAVLVSRNHDIHRITGVTNNPTLGLEMFELKKLNTHTGMANYHCANHVHNSLFFLGGDYNVYALNSVHMSDNTLHTTLINQTFDFNDKRFKEYGTMIMDAPTAFHDDKWYIALGAFLFEYSYRHRAWTVHKIFPITSLYVHKGTLLMGVGVKYNRYNVVTWSDDYIDIDRPFTSYWESKHYDMGSTSQEKHFRKFFFESYTDDELISDITVDVNVDYVKTKESYQVTKRMSRFGVAEFGDTVQRTNINICLDQLIGRRGKKINFKFSCGHDLAGYVVSRVELPNEPGVFFPFSHNGEYDVYSFEIKEGSIVYAYWEGKLYQFAGGSWVLRELAYFNQPMRIYQIFGEYELRGKR